MCGLLTTLYKSCRGNRVSGESLGARPPLSEGGGGFFLLFRLLFEFSARSYISYVIFNGIFVKLEAKGHFGCRAVWLLVRREVEQQISVAQTRRWLPRLPQQPCPGPGGGVFQFHLPSRCYHFLPPFAGPWGQRSLSTLPQPPISPGAPKLEPPEGLTPLWAPFSSLVLGLGRKVLCPVLPVLLQRAEERD